MSGSEAWSIRSLTFELWRWRRASASVGAQPRWSTLYSWPDEAA
jgi:hypothetical protein